MRIGIYNDGFKEITSVLCLGDKGVFIQRNPFLWYKDITVHYVTSPYNIMVYL